ncbi:MAG: hypothetical protein INR69_18805 [Mucilaginibacter polytrichastri]|nr:hypothetical protein [Mucilaginibacter polytrichastri]
MNNILTRVMREYAFVSLAEWSAILQSYHVALIRGESGSQMEQHNGLAYSLSDANGNRMGVPIKASAFYCKPTLETLEKKMHVNQHREKPDRGATRKIVLSLLNTSGINELAAFKKALEGRRISLVLHHNSEGYLYGVHYVNHRERTVFKGSELGKTMGAAGIRERFAVQKALLPEKRQERAVSLPVSGNGPDNEKAIGLPENPLGPLLEETFTPGIPLALPRKRKKKGQRI